MESAYLKKTSGWNIENTHILFLFIVSAVVVYFAPPIISKIYFLGILLIAFRSNKPYFWIAFFFILLNEPGGIFKGGTSADMQRIPIYTIGAGASLSVFDIFLFGYSIKSFFKLKRILFFKNGIIVLSTYAMVLFLFSLSFGISIEALIVFIRNFLLPFLFFILIHRLITNSSDFEKLVKLLLPFIIIAFVGQVHEIYFGKYLTTYFKEGAETIASTGVAMRDVESGISRAFDSEMLTMFSFIICGYYLLSRENSFSRIWLAIVMYLGFIICFSSATRGSFLTFLFMLINLLYFLSKSSLLRIKDVTSIFIVIVIAIIGFNLLSSDNVLSKQLKQAQLRLSSVEVYFGGKDNRDADVSNTRVDTRIPKMMKHIKDSPIMGYGFSDKALEYADGHVGIHNQMIEGGILELFVFAYFFYVVISNVRSISHGFRLANKKNALRFFVYTLLSILIVHATSSQYFGYILGFESYRRWYMFALFFCGLNIYYNNLKFEISVDNQNRKNENNHPLRRNGHKAS